jgi:FKBP-type peptidyl-prolyl cis-trans isomerase
MYLPQVVSGFSEGLTLIMDGGHILLQIPYQLGYGADGSGAIPPYSTLYFDVKLIQSY